MSATARGLVRAGVGAAAVLSVSACSPGGSGERATTTSSESSPASPTPSSPQPKATRPEQRELSESEVRAALPRAADIGTEWVDNEVVPGSLRYDPPSCGDIFLRGSQATTFTDAHRTATAKRDFATKGLESEYLTVFVYTHDEPVPQSLLALAGEAMGRCQSHDVVYSSEATGSQTVSGLQVEPVGDRSLGLVATGRTGRPLNRFTVLSGHTYVVVNYSGNRTDPGPLLHDVARGVLERMSS